MYVCMYVCMYVTLYCEECVYVAMMFYRLSINKLARKKNIHGKTSNSFEVYKQ